MFIMSNALINPTNFSFVFNSCLDCFMAILSMPQLPYCFFKIPVKTSTAISPLIRAAPQVRVILSKGFDYNLSVTKLKMHNGTVT